MNAVNSSLNILSNFTAIFARNSAVLKNIPQHRETINRLKTQQTKDTILELFSQTREEK